MVDGLVRRGWTSFITVPVRDWLVEALEERRLDPIVLGGSRSFDTAFLRRLDRLVTSNRIDLIQTHLMGAAVYGGLVARRRRIPLVATFHGRADVRADEPHRRLKFRVLDRRRNRLVFVSKALERWFVEAHRVRADISRVVHNGIRPGAFVPRTAGAFRRELDVRPDDLLVGAIGNLRPPKRYDIFIEAAALLRRRSERYRFVIVGEGDGALRLELEDLIAEAGLEGIVSIAGFRPDVTDVLAGLDVYCLTSSFEGFSLSTLEAVSAGVPVVATRSGGPEEIVEHGLSGLLVEPDSPGAVADAVETLVRSLPPAVDGRVPHVRRGDVGRFSVEAMVDRYVDIYDECLTRTSAT